MSTKGTNQVTKKIYGNPKSLNLSLINLAYRYKPIDTYNKTSANL